MKQVRSRRGLVDLVTLVVGGVLFVLMLAGCLALLQSGKATSRTAAGERAHIAASAPEGSALTSAQNAPSAGAEAAIRVTAPEVSLFGRHLPSEALVMGCVLLAGLTGGYLQYMRERFDELAASAPEPLQREEVSGLAVPYGINPLITFASRLLMGLGAASVFGLFIPLAIAEPPGLSIFNPWGLLILGVASGYLSRNVFGGVEGKFERLLAEIQRAGQIDSRSPEFSGAVKQGVLDALATPVPINFEGTVLLEVTDSSGRNCVFNSESGSYVELDHGHTYTLRALFAPGALWTGRHSSHIQNIHIDGGIEAQQVPFELRLELDFLPDVRPLERSVTVERQSKESVPFELWIPRNVDTYKSPEETDAQTSAPELALFVYQASLFCAVATLPVRWTSLP
ncbi:hypothetical protein M3I53_36070 [Paraburkholderia sp. CNPSo 3272]|uniref:hypothetical protein n=1 Tax=Paraburkholderia sp. CNPSo 3272 TaxID=2940931 RepID=UPI0020B69F5F|nr:hypothetical protein [Paraburkholderia sp. CNPSo 3272]MCP3728464.1 hypothetical protein [Paraburkholderia sp. CNPSo 3272]